MRSTDLSRKEVYKMTEQERRWHMVKDYMLSSKMATEVQMIDEGYIVTTDLFNLQKVICELYTDGFQNVVVTIVDAKKVFCRTEDIDLDVVKSWE